MEKNEKPLKKNKKSKIGFMLFLVVAFALCLVINYSLSYGSRLETMIVRSGSEESVIETECFVFREQSVVHATDSGYVYCVADEDQRVRKGEAVVYIYKNDINVQANKELENIEKEINRLSGNDSGHNLYVTDVAKIEQEILHLMRTVPRIGNNADFEALVSAKDTVNKLIENKRIATGEISPDESSMTLENLKKRKAEIETQYNIERNVVSANATGAFTAKIDGMESSLSMNALENISVDYIEGLKKNSIQNSSRAKVDEGAPVGKIVNNFKWCIGAVVPTAQVEDMKPGGKVSLRFTDVSIDTVEGEILKIVDDGNGKSVIVIESGGYVGAIYSTSRAKIQIIKNKYEGFRVPAESIRMVDGKTGVYVVKNNKSRFVPVNILYNSKDWIIISERAINGETTIKLYDELIISGKNLYDNKVVR